MNTLFYRHPATSAMALALMLGLPQISHADRTLEVEIYSVSSEGVGESIGTVTLQEHRYGVLITPDLKNLEPGLHGFHLHENADCSPSTKDGKPVAAGAAGGHYDPENTGQHLGPFETGGHLGDLPALFADQAGEATQDELAPNLSIGDFLNRALVVHEGGDNYSDEPDPMGGGGDRVACGVIEEAAADPAADDPRTDRQSPVEKAGEPSLTLEMKKVSLSTEGETTGRLSISQRASGVVITPALEGLTPGLHGLHIHDGEGCQSGQTEGGSATAGASAEPAKEAGDHWDPALTGNHAGPWAHGHRGDLPNLFVDENGEANTPVYAPRVSARDFQNRPVILHSQRDNYSDQPDSTGGSGQAIVCGISGP